MIRLNVEKKTKILVTIGVIITIVGFIIHFSYPSEMVIFAKIEVDVKAIFNQFSSFQGKVKKGE